MNAPDDPKFAHQMAEHFREMLARDTIGAHHPGLSESQRQVALTKAEMWEDAAKWNDALELPWNTLERGPYPYAAPIH